MEIRQLQYFISVAEHLNFTKAASDHYIAQAAISQQIMSLEQQLGVKLFVRNNRSVELTSAGKVLYKEAKVIIAKSNEAIRKTKRAASGFEGTLKVGILGTNEKNFLPQLIRNFRLAFPAIDITIIQDNAEALRENINNGLLDVAFSPVYGITTDPDISYKTVYQDPFCAVVYRDHPLSNETRISRSALANEAFIFIDRKEAPAGYDALIEDCIKSGFSPNITCHVRIVETILLMVEAEMGIAVLPRCFEIYKNDNLRFIELEGEDEYFELVVSWLKANINPTIPLFLTAIEEVTLI
ncbi:MAG: LysR family transcriptional regulator [Clostridia bacterium]|jgi:DNA-binding transcriptional LysR family regulator|nr:LysR family transcriptional regulator [Clostridia bacterium]